MAIAANEMMTTIALSRDRRVLGRAAVALCTGATCSEVILFESSNSGPVDIVPYITAFLGAVPRSVKRLRASANNRR